MEPDYMEMSKEELVVKILSDRDCLEERGKEIKRLNKTNKELDSEIQNLKEGNTLLQIRLKHTQKRLEEAQDNINKHVSNLSLISNRILDKLL